MQRTTVTKESGAEPLLKFDFYPDKIIIESNEDGFTPDDIQAICSVGGSTKFGTQACRGEKGIGFKSVFMVASKVYTIGALFVLLRAREGRKGM